MRMKYLCLMFFLIVLIIPQVSSIKITEFESNPKDDCRDCTEWAELYSEIEINLSEYWIENSKSSVINLSGIGKGHIKIDFGKRFLTNTGDILVLKKSGEIIDETSLLKDEENNDMTWQLCDSWEFKLSTKGEENSCEEIPEEPAEEEEEQEQEEEEEADEERQEIEEYQEIGEPVSRETGPIELQTINLNPKVIKSEDDNENLSKSNYAVYGLVFFCALLVVLFILRKNKHNKNEFR